VCGGGGRREEEAEEKPGIQNQKQEPHTKMWGKIKLTAMLQQLPKQIQKKIQSFTIKQHNMK
jgi:hypothetical protein